MSVDSPIYYNKRVNMEQYEIHYGNIYKYNLDEVFTNTHKKLRWQPEKTIELFEELIEEYADELTMVDDEYSRASIQSTIKLIKCYIEFLEGSLI